MRSVWILPAVLLAGAALAQTGATCASPTAATVTTTEVSTAYPATTTVTVPGPCAALQANTITGQPMILVLGSEESYALSNLHARVLGWYDAPSNFMSLFAEGNPITHSYPNAMVMRHGNPYYPYYQLHPGTQATGMRGTPEPVAMTTTTTTTAPATATCGCTTLPRKLTATQRNTLMAVYNTYANLTPVQAVKMGYTAEGACMAGMGAVYVNRNLIDTTFDAQHPEAFSFTPDGRVAAVHYIVVTDNDKSIMAFGSRSFSSPIAPGGQQVTVWLFQANSNGFFARTNPGIECPK